MVSSAQQQLTGLPQRLVEENILSGDQAREVLAASQKENKHFVPYVVENKLAEAREVAHVASHEFGLPVFDLDALEHDAVPKELILEDLIAKHRTLPLLKRINKLYLAISDPTNVRGLDEYKFQTGCSIVAILVEDDKLTGLISKLLDASESGFDTDLDEDLDSLEIASEEDNTHEEEAPDIDDTPIVRFVNKLLLDAINKGASDIHVEPYEKRFRVRYRVDGVLQEAAFPPLNMSGRIIARIKVMSQMDISERRVPQDGRIKMKLSAKRAIDFRVNTCPTLFGEKIVLRILDPSSAQLGIEMLGYEPDQEKLYLDALAQPYGMILVTGPTGSGKTVSLYTGLNILNRPEMNISTAEDPAEINLPGINQVNVNPKVGLTFAEALKAFLRQDPDVIMVGEIRDLETANIAIKAAQTGHLVLSTLHTNDAPQTLTRLANMGVPPFNIATAVSLIIAQRLARKLCDHCKEVEEVPNAALLLEGFDESEVGSFQVYKAVGCNQCNAGYKGRAGIFQVMPVSEAMGKIIMDGGNSMQIAEQAALEGVTDLRRSALNKVMAGITSLEEANRVTRD
ncbi:MAG: type IV-A pilus assembly ATPase PilB [Gammaproteobacteria bacterium]|nr:type IV-A pilus assembly ATPase PilB [Gammaproteobacteria bacterium]